MDIWDELVWDRHSLLNSESNTSAICRSWFLCSLAFETVVALTLAHVWSLEPCWRSRLSNSHWVAPIFFFALFSDFPSQHKLLSEMKKLQHKTAPRSYIWPGNKISQIAVRKVLPNVLVFFSTWVIQFWNRLLREDLQSIPEVIQILPGKAWVNWPNWPCAE